MILGVTEGINPSDLGSTKCPNPDCGAVGRLRRHGSYERNLVDLEGDAIRCVRVRIERAICTSCGRTHALMPPNVSPYRQRSVRLQAAIAEARVGGGTVGSACAEYDVCQRVPCRIMACLPALLVAMGVPQGRETEVLRPASTDRPFRARLARACAGALRRGPFQGVEINYASFCGPMVPDRPT